MSHKYKGPRQQRPISNNSYIQWSAGEEVLKTALYPSLPTKKMINSNESQKLLRDILS